MWTYVVAAALWLLVGVAWALRAWKRRCERLEGRYLNLRWRLEIAEKRIHELEEVQNEMARGLVASAWRVVR